MASDGSGHSTKPLTIVDFSVLDPAERPPAAVHERFLAQFGFNYRAEQFEAKALDAKYSRWIQPLESELASKVEYDMDEQDKKWLDKLNSIRIAQNQALWSYEVFEIIMDKLEKEWFLLSSLFPKKPSAVMNEDSKCAICDDGECESANGIVFCDGCNLAVHQDCYGVPYIPEGQWLCRKCVVSPNKPVNCVLCPNTYGAFKQTSTSQWAHLVCGIWIPETTVTNTVYMEPIDGIENIPKSRWKLVCFICKEKYGACVQCANKNCFTAFHITCARERNLDLRMHKTLEDSELSAYCDKHSSSSEGKAFPRLVLRRDKTGAITIKHASNSSKYARAYKKSYTAGPPIVPAVIYNKIIVHLTPVRIAATEKASFVSFVCRYWSLKRESRRGAPLLKRLHLEPWTAAAAATTQNTEEERMVKLALANALRSDLENVRMLTEKVKKRERKILACAQIYEDIVETVLFPRNKVLKKSLARLSNIDKSKYFAAPVSLEVFPEYLQIIKDPMDFETVLSKISHNEYSSSNQFIADIQLIISNAQEFNPKSSHAYSIASKIRKALEKMTPELLQYDQYNAILSQEASSLLTPEILDELFTYNPQEILLSQTKPASAPVSEITLTPVIPEPVTSPHAKHVSTLNKRPARSSAPKRASPRPKRTKDSAPQELPSPVRMLESNESDSNPSTRTRGTLALLEEINVNGADDLAEKPNKLYSRRRSLRTRVSQTGATEEYREVSVQEDKPQPQRVLRNNRAKTSILPDEVLKTGEGTSLKEDEPTRRSTRGVTKAITNGSPTSNRRESRLVSTEMPKNVSVHGSKQLMGSTRGGLVVDIENDEMESEEDSAIAKTTNKEKGKRKIMKTKAENSNEASMESKTITSRTKETKYKPPEQNLKLKQTSKKSESTSTDDLVKNWPVRFRDMKTSFEVTTKQAVEGLLVWAKQAPWPAWPAEVVDPSTSENPKMWEKAHPESEIEHVMVRFFETEKRGAWIPIKDLYLMGVDKDFDNLMLSLRENLNKDKKKRVALLHELQRGFKQAMVNVTHITTIQEGTKLPKKPKSKKKA